MSEFEVIDRAMPVVPEPTPAQVAAVRARVVTARTSSRWRPLVLVAVAVMLVIGAVGLLMPRSPEPPVATVPKPAFLAAAERLAGAAQGSGRYWRLETELVMRVKGLVVTSSRSAGPRCS